MSVYSRSSQMLSKQTSLQKKRLIVAYPPWYLEGLEGNPEQGHPGDLDLEAWGAEDLEWVRRDRMNMFIPQVLHNHLHRDYVSVFMLLCWFILFQNLLDNSNLPEACTTYTLMYDYFTFKKTASALKTPRHIADAGCNKSTDFFLVHLRSINISAWHQSFGERNYRSFDILLSNVWIVRLVLPTFSFIDSFHISLFSIFFG